MHSVYDEADYCCSEVSKPREGAMIRCSLSGIPYHHMCSGCLAAAHIYTLSA